MAYAAAESVASPITPPFHPKLNLRKDKYEQLKIINWRNRN